MSLSVKDQLYIYNVSPENARRVGWEARAVDGDSLSENASHATGDGDESL